MIRPGCCGARDTETFFSLASGRERFQADVPLLTVAVPNSPLHRYVAFHSHMASAPIPEAAGQKDVIGVLAYGGESGPAARVLVSFEGRGGPNEDLAARVLSIVSGGQEADEDHFDLWSADQSRDPARIGGFSIRVRAFTDPDFLFELPVEGDRLMVERARTAPGVRLRLLPSGPPTR